MLRNFSYVIEGKLAGAGYLGSSENLRQTLTLLKKEGFTGIVSLYEIPLEPTEIKRSGLDYLHVAVEDFDTPTLEQVVEVVEFTRKHIEDGGQVLYHCWAGMGRTGTMLACYLVAEGYKPKDAIFTVRRIRPGSIENYAQEKIVHTYHAHLQKKGKP